MTDAPDDRSGERTPASRRRGILGAVAGTTLSALAGCVGTLGAGGDDATGSTPGRTADRPADPTGTAGPNGGSAPTPDGGAYPDYGDDVARVVPYEAIDPGSEPVYLEPSTDRVRLPNGELAFTLHNASEWTFATNLYHWRIHRRERGWHYVVPRGYNQPLVHLPPGARHTWRVTVDNTDLGWVGPGPSGTEAVTVEGLGAGTYAFAVTGWFADGEGTPTAGADHRHRLALASHFTLDGGALALTASRRVTDVQREGSTVTVLAEGPGADGGREAAFVLSRAPGATPARTVVTEQAIREWPLRDALAAVEDGVETVRVEATTGARPPFAHHPGDSPVRYDGETYRIGTELADGTR